ncbi:MAG: hypothetical protein Q8M16_18390 [Pirellulaceae bacterium]|nr:hypothetical protein [Pirellulaceae bacterium]
MWQMVFSFLMGIAWNAGQRGLVVPVWTHPVWLGLVLCHAIFAGPSNVSAQAVPGASYQVRVSDYYGQLKESGYTPLRFTITRYGTAVNGPETLYAGLQVSGFGYGDNREVLSRVDFTAGQISATTEINFPFQDGFVRSAVVSRDGSLSPNPRRDLIASVTLADWLSNRRWSRTSTATTDSLSVAHFTSTAMLDTGLHVDSFYHPDWRDRPQMFNGPTVTPNLTAPVPNFKELIDVTANDASRLVHSNMTLPTSTDPQVAAAIGNRFIVSGDFSAIPSTWLGLSRVDMCLLSVEDLRILANQRPEKLEVIRQWVVAGGRLVILNCQADFAGLGSIVPNLSSAVKPTLEPGPQPWSMLDEKHADRQFALFQSQMSPWKAEISNNNAQQSWSRTTYDNPISDWIRSQDLTQRTQTFSGTPAKNSQDAVAANAPFLFTDFGTGKIIAVPTDGTQVPRKYWFKILLAAFGNLQPTCFDGIGDRNHAFTGYSDFEYKRLGKPPWILFLVMITIFAVTVGPIAFFVLKRMGRTHLLLGVVPLIASIITSGIVGYAMIQDGFSFRTTRLSVTWLDTQNQTALTQTTQMVYSGIAPGSFELPRSTAYYDDSGKDSGNYGRQSRNQLRMSSTSDRQTISGTKIQARTKIQVTSFDVNQSTGQLLLSASPDGSKWEVTNQLGFPLEVLMVETPVGLMLAKNVAVDATATLGTDPQLRTKWLNEFNRRGRENQAAIPELIRGGWFGNEDRISNAINTFFDPGKMQSGSFLAVSYQQPLARNLRERTYQDEELHLTSGQYRAMTLLPNIPPPTTTKSNEANEANDDSEANDKIDNDMEQSNGGQQP